MPKYAVFVVYEDLLALEEVTESRDLRDDPVYQKSVRDFLAWGEAEVKADRLKGGDFLHASSEETSIRVEFEDNPEAYEDAGEEKTSGGDENSEDKATQETDGANSPPPPKCTVTRGGRHSVSKDVLGYYKTEFATADKVVAWAQSCPLHTKGFSLEIRQLKEFDKDIADAPADVRRWTGDQMLAVRDKKLEQGQLKRDEDGTLWAKTEVEEGPLKDIIAEAEERKAQREEDK
ncbi:hypothetical protein LQW54_000266 [Pestalotiopsis sp. IQ-011]